MKRTAVALEVGRVAVFGYDLCKKGANTRGVL